MSTEFWSKAAANYVKEIIDEDVDAKALTNKHWFNRIGLEQHKFIRRLNSMIDTQTISTGSDRYKNFVKSLKDIFGWTLESAKVVENVCAIRNKARHSSISDTELDSIFEICNDIVDRLPEKGMPIEKYIDKHKDEIHDQFKFEV